MEWLQFPKISFSTDSGIGQLCEDLNEIVGQGIYYDTFEIENTKWFWFVSNIITALNNDNVLCGSFGIYPSYVAGILNNVDRIRFFVLCNKRPTYNYYIEKCFGDKECSVTYKCDFGQLFRISYQGEEILIKFQTRIFPEYHVN